MILFACLEYESLWRVSEWMKFVNEVQLDKTALLSLSCHLTNGGSSNIKILMDSTDIL